jgi:hypothetical protein
VGRKPDEDEAMMTSGRAIASMSRNSAIFRSSRSGAASWMKSAACAMAARSVVKVRRPGVGGASPSSAVVEGQATSMADLRRLSAAGAGS